MARDNLVGAKLTCRHIHARSSDPWIAIKIPKAPRTDPVNRSTIMRFASLCCFGSLIGALEGCNSSPNPMEESPGAASREVVPIDESTAALAPLVDAAAYDSALTEDIQVAPSYIAPGIIYTYKYDHFTGNLKIFVFGQNVAKPKYALRYSISKPRTATKVMLNWIPSNIVPNSNAFSAIVPFSGQEYIYFDPTFTGLTDNYYSGTSELNAMLEPAGPFIYRNRTAMKFDPGEPTTYGELRVFTEYNTDDVCYIAYWGGSKWINIVRTKNNDPDGSVSTRWMFYNPNRFRVTCPFTGGDNFIYMDKRFEAAWTVTRVARNLNGYNVLEVTHK